MINYIIRFCRVIFFSINYLNGHIMNDNHMITLNDLNRYRVRHYMIIIGLHAHVISIGILDSVVQCIKGKFDIIFGNNHKLISFLWRINQM